ncbi:hypothetical protein GUJ93_ZPchr0002g26185 [Zizania palustris]|uniref:Uncharacterized protein n=1 Tax=Zizania palustris TaxID=103762 RepID=A0A8J5RZY0_ZIZPA|nr:hypothetical protein GUJ93_ZPchr0002g26185 [Zizania palustris]
MPDISHNDVLERPKAHPHSAGTGECYVSQDVMQGPWRVVKDSVEASEATAAMRRMAVAMESTWIWRSELGNEAAMRLAAWASRSERERNSEQRGGR